MYWNITHILWQTDSSVVLKSNPENKVELRYKKRDFIYIMEVIRRRAYETHITSCMWYMYQTMDSIWRYTLPVLRNMHYIMFMCSYQKHAAYLLGGCGVWMGDLSVSNVCRWWWMPWCKLSPVSSMCFWCASSSGSYLPSWVYSCLLENITRWSAVNTKL